MKFSIFLPIVALAGRVFAQSQQTLSALPPACLLHAVNTQDEPADLNTLCGNDATKVQEAIANACSEDNASTAQTVFIATCRGAGHEVDEYVASPSSTGSNSATPTTMTVVTTTDANGHTVTRTASGSNPTETGAAVVHKGMGGYVLAIVAVAGAFASL